MLDAGYSILDTGYWMLDIREHKKAGINPATTNR
jgi:hypothetical protein